MPALPSGNAPAAVEAPTARPSANALRIGKAVRGDLTGVLSFTAQLRSKGDVAIVPVQHGNCGGCHLQIPPQLIHNAKRGTELTSCDYCGRILYWQPE